MKKNISILTFIFFGAIILPLLFGEVKSWGEVGHAVIADVAQSMLSAKATQAIQKYIPGEKMEQVASIPDTYDHTAAGSWSEPLHFVNMLRNQTSFDFNIDCKKAPGCVVSAIQNYTKILMSSVNSRKVLDAGEPNALIFLIHFVGDVHQPLHVGYLDDMGGNNVPCSFFGVATELHAVWDDSIIGKYNSDWSSFSKEIQQTIKNDPGLIKQYTADMTPVTWADESFTYVMKTVYIGVTGKTNPDLTDTYYNMALPVVKARLTAAGIRLGTLLNTIFK